MLTPSANRAMINPNTAPLCQLGPSPMSRTRKSEPFIQQKVNIPATLAARFAQLYWDPVLQKTKYAAMSQVVTKLLADHVNKVENGVIPAEEISSSELPSPERL